MRIERRTFIKSTGLVTLGTLGAPGVWTRSALAIENSPTKSSDNVLVVIQLAGGNDGLNTVIPYRDDTYYRLRPSLAIGRDRAHKLSDEIGLHPRLTGLKELHDAGHLAVIQGVGYPNPDRSHFRSMDIWQSARPDKIYDRDGWLGRWLDLQGAGSESGQMLAMALGLEKLPLSLVAGKTSVPAIRDLSNYTWNVGDGDPGQLAKRRSQLRELASWTSSVGQSDSLDFLRKTAMMAYESSERLKSVTETKTGDSSFPDSALGQNLKIVSQLIAGEFGTRIFYLSLDGFDTHSRQENIHANLLGDLADSISAFWKDLRKRKLTDRVTILTFSEFGRRVKENGSLGTDHGAASSMFMVDAAVKPGLTGKHPSLADLDDGDLKFHTDFRRVYAAVLRNRLGVAEGQSEAILAGKFAPLDILA